MADVSDSVVSNNVNNSNGTGAVDDAKAPENETDKVMEPLSLADYDELGLEPESLGNLLRSLRSRSPDFTSCDLIAGLIYVLFLESGFVPADDLSEYATCDFDRRRVAELSGAASPTEWRRGACYELRLVLPQFRGNTVQLVCNFNGDAAIVNGAVDRAEDAVTTLRLDLCTYFTKYSMVYAHGTLQDMRGLSRSVKGRVCYPLKQRVLRSHGVLECCLEVLPPELLCHVMGYLGTRDLLRLGSTCRYLYKVMATPKLWVARLAADFGIEEPLSSFEELRDRYRRIYQAKRVTIISCGRTLRSFDVPVFM